MILKLKAEQNKLEDKKKAFFGEIIRSANVKEFFFKNV